MMRERYRQAMVVLVISTATGCAAGATNRDARGGATELRRGPTTAQLVDRGRGFAAVGDLTRAEQYLSAALESGAEVEEVLPSLLRVCIESRRYRVAGEYVREYLRQEPDNGRLHFLLALLQAAVGDSAAALDELRTVLRRYPEDSDGHYAMAVLLRDQWGDTVDADLQFRAYLRLEPDGLHAAEARAGLLEETP
jgi:Tfp pilus assembly protein PilF